MTGLCVVMMNKMIDTGDKPLRTCGGDGEVSPDIMCTAHTNDRIIIMSLFVSILKMVSRSRLHQLFINSNSDYKAIIDSSLNRSKLRHTNRYDMNYEEMHCC